MKIEAGLGHTERGGREKSPIGQERSKQKTGLREYESEEGARSPFIVDQAYLTVAR